MRTGRPDLAFDLDNLILGVDYPIFDTILPVGEETFDNSWDIFMSFSNRGLSITDCSSIALVRKLGVEHIISFDKDFDGIVNRIN